MKTAIAWFALALLLLAPGVSRAEAAWKETATKAGVRYEEREVSGSKYLEHRATFTVPVAADTALNAIWTQVLDGVPQLKREFLRRTDDEVLVHEVVTHPIVTDREVTLLIQKTRAPLGIKFEARNELGPPAQGKRIQLPRVYGSWAIEPISPTEVRLTYVCYSEPGGTIAAFLVRGPQAKQVVHDVTRIRARLGL